MSKTDVSGYQNYWNQVKQGVTVEQRYNLQKFGTMDTVNTIGNLKTYQYNTVSHSLSKNSPYDGQKANIDSNYSLEKVPNLNVNNYLLNSKMYNSNQQAVIEIAKQVKKNGGITLENAKILQDWASEYNIINHGPEVHPNRPGANSNIPHIHVGKVGHNRLLNK